MAMQSSAMALAFGTNFQYGKRKISAMSNEEFNKIQPGDIYKGISEDIKRMIPTFKQQNADMQQLQSEIITQLLEYVKQFPQDVKSQLPSQITEPIEAGGRAIISAQNDANDFLNSLSGFFNSLAGGIPNAYASSVTTGNVGPPQPTQHHTVAQNQPQTIQQAITTPKQTITAKKPSLTHVKATISSLNKKISNNNNKMKLLAEQIKALWTLIQNNPTFKFQLQRLQWRKDITAINGKVHTINNENALFITQLQAQQRLLAIAT